MNFYNEALEIKDELVSLRRYFHMNPELDFKLYNTSTKIKEFLDNEGIEYFDVAETGVCATIKGKEEGKTMVFVTHSMESVRNLCNRTIWLKDGKIKMDGETSEVTKEYIKETS